MKNTSKVLSSMLTNLSRGLSRQAIGSCSQWAEKYRMMAQPFPGLWKFKYHPWLRDMHDSKADRNVGQKSAQVGYTETLLNWTFYNIDISQRSVLYILPTDKNAGEFTSTRFDPALESSPHLSRLFNNVQNVKLKRAGSANLYIRGSRVKNNLKSAPVARVACDEVDEMTVENLPSAWERMMGQPDQQAWLISTPTVDNFGINAYYKQSSRQHYFFRCPHHGGFIELSHKDSFDFEAARLFCPKCKKTLGQEEKLEAMRNSGEWISQVNDMDNRGWYLNQLYSYTVLPKHLKASWEDAKVDPAAEQELYNSKFGVPYVVEGARVTDANIKNAIGEYKSTVNINTNKIRTMGIDVGKYCHYEICEWDILGVSSSDINVMARPRVLRADKVLTFDELDELIKGYLPTHTVIDAMPETRKSQELCDRFPGLVTKCFYSETVKTRGTERNEEKDQVTVNRTMWLDLSLGRFMQGRIKIPADISEEYKSHLKALVKRYDKDATGNTISRYINAGADHFGHARNYSEIALSLALGVDGNKTEKGIWK